MQDIIHKNTAGKKQIKFDGLSDKNDVIHV